MLSVNSLHAHGIVRNDEIELLATLKMWDAGPARAWQGLFAVSAVAASPPSPQRRVTTLHVSAAVAAARRCFDARRCDEKGHVRGPLLLAKMFSGACFHTHELHA